MLSDLSFCYQSITANLEYERISSRTRVPGSLKIPYTFVKQFKRNLVNFHSEHRNGTGRERQSFTLPTR